MKYISKNSFIPQEAMGRPNIVAQTFLKSFFSMTAPNSSDLCPLFWEA